MTDYKEVAALTGLKPPIIRYLVKVGVIADPPSFDHLQFMLELSTICGKTEFIKLQCADFNPIKRARIILSAGLNDIESWILHRWVGHYGDRDDTRYNLHAKQVIDETMHYLDLPETMRKYVTLSVYKLRKKARNLVYRNKDGNLAAAVRAIVDGKHHRAAEKVTNQSTKKNSQYSAFNNIFGY